MFKLSFINKLFFIIFVFVFQFNSRCFSSVGNFHLKNKIGKPIYLGFDQKESVFLKQIRIFDEDRKSYLERPIRTFCLKKDESLVINSLTTEFIEKNSKSKKFWIKIGRFVSEKINCKKLDFSKNYEISFDEKMEILIFKTAPELSEMKIIYDSGTASVCIDEEAYTPVYTIINLKKIGAPKV